jgi:formate hydrogenlyase subunit 4
MSLSWLLSLVFYLVHGLAAPFLLVGLIRTGKARLQNRQGPPPWQPFWDIAKLLRKGETISETTTWVFRLAPIVGLATMAAVALMVPWLGVASPLPGDLFLVVYLMALGKFVTGLAALDTGSSFGALGASREAAVSLQAEPALVIALAALAAHAHSSSLALFLAPGQAGSYLFVVVPLVVAALWLAITAELARMPIDDPTTHLELTMIHEALILENSGRNLALVEIAVALKITVLFGLMAQVMLIAWPPIAPALAYLLSLGLILAGGAVLALAESALVKLRWRRIPNLLSFALAAAALACIVVALKG